MAKALSIDLRDRVIAAVADGMSRRQAAERFGVSAASTIRWCALERDVGDARPKRQGGDRRSGRIEAHAALILGIVEHTKDITIAEVQARLKAPTKMSCDPTAPATVAN
jgi:transposase